MNRSTGYKDGRGAMHHGRFLLGDVVAAEGNSGLIAAMERLLELGGVQATSYFTTVRGRTIHHIEAGSGPTLLLVHGASGGGANWYRLIAPLAKDFRVVAIDLPGFGFSEPFDLEPPLGRSVADLLLSWLDALHIAEFDLVATSFGSLPALRMAMQSPARVRRVALINGVGLGADLPLAFRLATLAPISSFALRPSRMGIRWQFNDLMTSDRSNIPKEHVEALLEYLWESAIASDVRKMAKAFRTFGGMAGQREVFTDDELKSVTQPVLIAWGEHDRFLPIAHGRRAAALVPRSMLRIIPDAGHSPNWEAPETVLACLSAFMNEHPV